MLKEERYDKILEILEEETYTSAVNLSKRLYVSLPTIRRDLAELQQRNLILRSHGGAKKINSEHTVMPVDFRKTLNHSVKKKLCFEASKLIKDNDIVFIDASTTAVQITDFILSKKSVTVITNSIPLSISLGKKGLKTFCTGGEIQTKSLGYAGSYAEQFIQNFNIDILFFSSYGINEKGMIVDASFPETMLRKAVSNHSSKTVFLCDNTKFGKTAPYNVMHVTQVDYIVTDEENIKILFPEIDNDKIILLKKPCV